MGLAIQLTLQKVSLRPKVITARSIVSSSLCLGRCIQISSGSMSRGWGLTLFSGAREQDKGNGQNWNIGSSLWIYRFFFLLWGGQNTGTGSGLERLWSVFLWRYSEPTWAQPCAGCSRQTCLNKGVGLDGLQSSFATPSVLWYCDIKQQQTLELKPLLTCSYGYVFSCLLEVVATLNRQEPLSGVSCHTWYNRNISR